MLIVYHHYALNDDWREDHWLVDENVAVEMDDDQRDDLNRINVVEVIVVENVLEVVMVVEDEEDDDETYDEMDEMDEQDDVEKPEVSIEKRWWWSSMNNVMMFEARKEINRIHHDFSIID